MSKCEHDKARKKLDRLFGMNKYKNRGRVSVVEHWDRQVDTADDILIVDNAPNTEYKGVVCTVVPSPRLRVHAHLIADFDLEHMARVWLDGGFDVVVTLGPDATCTIYAMKETDVSSLKCKGCGSVSTHCTCKTSGLTIEGYRPVSAE